MTYNCVLIDGVGGEWYVKFMKRCPNCQFWAMPDNAKMCFHCLLKNEGWHNAFVMMLEAQNGKS